MHAHGIAQPFNRRRIRGWSCHALRRLAPLQCGQIHSLATCILHAAGIPGLLLGEAMARSRWRTLTP